MNILTIDSKTRIHFLPYIFILLLFPHTLLISQKYNRNSSDNLNKIRSNLYLGNYNSKINPDSAIFYYQRALDLLSEDKTKIEEKTFSDSIKFYKIVILNKIGYLFHMQSKYSLAESYYRNGLNESKILNNDSLKAESEFNLAEIHLENGNYVDAINSYSTAIELFDKIGYLEGVYWANIGIGIIYRKCGNIKLSKRHYENVKKNWN